MAIERTGTYIQIDSWNETGSQSITVPNDAELMLVFIGGYSVAGVNWMEAGEYSLNSVSLSLIAHTSDQTDNEQVAAWRLVNPATGSQTFAWDHNTGASLGDGATFIILFYKGVDTTSPIRDSGTAGAAGDVTGVVFESGDMIVGAVASYQDAITSADDDGQTEIVLTEVFSNLGMGVGEELSEGDFYTTGGTAMSAVAVVIAAAASGGTSILRQMIAHSE